MLKKLIWQMKNYRKYILNENETIDPITPIVLRLNIHKHSYYPYVD